ncbi:MAG: hypothetical protein MUD01_25330 [Chloroflexaceae bacterium]|nr:hypothetical protein [Chloroflexaceae bacterium]
MRIPTDVPTRISPYSDAPPLHPNFLLGSLHLLFWLFFHPTAYRNHIARIDPTLRPNFALLGLSWQQWRNREVQLLLAQAYLAPLLIGNGVLAWLPLAQGASLNQVAFFFINGLAFGVAFCLVGSVASGLVGGIASGLVGGIASGLVGGVAGGLVGGLSAPQLRLAFSPVRQVVGIVAGVVFGLVFGLAFSLVFIFAGVQAVTLMIGAGTGSGGSLPFGLVFGLVCGLAVGLVVDLQTGNWRKSVAVGMTVGVVLGLVGSVPGGLVTGLTGGMVTGSLFALPKALTQRIAGVRAGVIAGALTSSGFWTWFAATDTSTPWQISVIFSIMALLLGLTLHLWRPVLLYPLFTLVNLLLRRLEAGRAADKPPLLRWHPAFWDEFQRLPWLGLDEHLVLVAERDQTEGRAALAYLAKSRFQRWAAQSAQIELDARRLERCASVDAISTAHTTLAVGELAGPANTLLRSFSYISQDVVAAMHQKNAYNQRLALTTVVEKLDGLLRELTRSDERYGPRFLPIAEGWRANVSAQVQVLQAETEQRQEIDNPYIIGVPLGTAQQICLYQAFRQLFNILNALLARWGLAFKFFIKTYGINRRHFGDVIFYKHVTERILH